MPPLPQLNSGKALSLALFLLLAHTLSLRAEVKGLHRYTFLMLRHTEPIELERVVPASSLDGRVKFDLASLCIQNRAKIVGVSFYRAKWNENCTELFKTNNLAERYVTLSERADNETLKLRQQRYVSFKYTLDPAQE